MQPTYTRIGRRSPSNNDINITKSLFRPELRRLPSRYGGCQLPRTAISQRSMFGPFNYTNIHIKF